MTEPFTFGIPLIAPAGARSWARVGIILARTLRSILAQDDPDFRVLIAGHALPEACADLARDRILFLPAAWPPEPPTGANDDGGRKKCLLRDAVLGAGGGLLMFVDADDLVDRATVSTARRLIGPEHIGGTIAHGLAIDHATGLAVSLPDPRVSPARFHELCGSSIVARYRPGMPDPYHRLGWHNHWPENARRLGVPLAELPLWGGYLVGTGESHSELHGPLSGWKREFTRNVRAHGTPLTGLLAHRLGWNAGLPAPGVATDERMTERADAL